VSAKRSRPGARLPNERLGNALAITLASSVAVAFVITLAVKASDRSDPPRQLVSAQTQSGYPTPASPSASPNRTAGPDLSNAVDPPTLPTRRVSNPSQPAWPSLAPSSSGRLAGSQATPGSAGSSKSGSRPGQGEESTTQATPSPSRQPGTEPTTSPPPTTAAPSGSTPTDPPPADSPESYSGPGGITVSTGPGWALDPTSTAGVSDYLQPPSTDPLTTAYFGIGIADPTPASTVSVEAASAIAALQAQDPAVQILTQANGQFLGADSVDIEYANLHNSQGIARHGRERLWINRGVTYVVSFDAPESAWDPTLATFNSLTASCQLAAG
jgi:hypothetical protein